MHIYSSILLHRWSNRYDICSRRETSQVKHSLYVCDLKSKSIKQAKTVNVIDKIGQQFYCGNGKNSGQLSLEPVPVCMVCGEASAVATAARPHTSDSHVHCVDYKRLCCCVRLYCRCQVL